MASVEKVHPASQSTVVEGREGTSQSYKAGDLLQFDSNGYVIISTSGAIHAIAKQDATGTANTKTEIELIDPNAIYSVRYKSSATAQNLVGQIVDATFTAGAHTWDESGATTDAYCVALDSRDALGTSGGRLLVRFLGALLTGI